MSGESPVPLILVTGFLGSGKTSLLRNLLDRLDPALKLAIVQNEYAAAGIDTIDLEETGRDFSVLEINNGSVFCVCLLGSFIPSLAAFLDEKRPDTLLIETTGLADPIAVAEILQDERLSGRLFLSSVFCVVDSLNFSRLSRVNTRVIRQIKIADHILLNKMDLVNHSPGSLPEEIREINPEAEIHLTSWSRIEGNALLHEIETPLAIKNKEDHLKEKPFGRSDIRTLVLRTSRPVPMKALQAFAAEVSPMLVRMKGYVLVDKGHPVAVQNVFGKTSIRTVESYTGQTELVGLGWGIESRDFGRKFHEIRRQFV
jgi:G3E family GTPase